MGLLSGHQPGDAPVMPEPGTGAFEGGPGKHFSLSAWSEALQLCQRLQSLLDCGADHLISQAGWTHVISCLVLLDQSSMHLMAFLSHLAAHTFLQPCDSLGLPPLSASRAVWPSTALVLS